MEKKIKVLLLILILSKISISQKDFKGIKDISKSILSKEITIKILTFAKDKESDSAFIDSINKRMTDIPNIWKDYNFVFLKNTDAYDAVRNKKLKTNDVFIHYTSQSIARKSREGVLDGTYECIKSLAIQTVNNNGKMKKIAQSYFSNSVSVGSPNFGPYSPPTSKTHPFCYYLDKKETVELLEDLKEKLKVKAKIKSNSSYKKEKKIKENKEHEKVLLKIDEYFNKPIEERKKELEANVGKSLTEDEFSSFEKMLKKNPDFLKRMMKKPK